MALGRRYRSGSGASGITQGPMRHLAMWRYVVIFSLYLPLDPWSHAAECGQTPYSCALFYLQRGECQFAVLWLTQQLEHSPRDLKAINLLGIALTACGQIKKANDRFQEAISLDSHFYPARKNLAVNEFDHKRFAAAETQFSRVLEDVPEDPIAHLYLGEISFGRKDCKTAVEQYEKGQSRIAQKSVWVLHDAQCELSQHDAIRAARALKLLPQDDAEDRFQGGLLLGRAGAFAAASELFGSARKGYSEPYVAGYNQLLMLTRAASYPQAIQVFHELIDQGYKRAELYNLAAAAYARAGQLEEAYDALRTATQLEPDAEDNYVDLGMLCLQYENYDLGLEILDVGIHYIPNSYRIYVQRGVMLVMTGRMAEAENEFQIASALAPDKPLPYVALSEVWMQSGQTQKAVDLLRQKSHVPQADFLLPYVLALALVRSGAESGTPEGREAIQALKASIHLNPRFSGSHAELGKLFLRSGEVDRGISELKMATDLDPTDSGLLYQLGQAYRRKGRKAEADALLARVAELHSPEHDPDLKQELKRLVRLDTVPPETQAKP